MRLVAAVALLFALGSSIALAEQTEGEAQSAGTPSAGAESLPERTANSDTFSLPDGQVETRIYPNPVNYRDEEGNWQPIGERLRETGEQTLTNDPNAFDVILPKQIDSKPLRFEVGDQWVESRLLRKDLEGVELEGAIATYEGEGNAPSFEFTGLGNGLKEDIELSGPGQANHFTYEMSASDGLVPSLADDGSVRFLDPEGTAVVVLPAPVMSDSAPQPAVSRDVHYELGPEEEGHWRLSVEADREWLEDPARAWPVRIDPTMTVGPDMECVIGGEKAKTGWINCAVWGAKETLLWYVPYLEASKDYWQRSLMELETTSIPVNSEITSASFNIRSRETALNTKGVELRKVTKPWNWEASWSRYDGTHLWSTEGGDYSESLGEVLTATRGTQAGWWQFNLPVTVVEKEVNAEEWLNVMMKLVDDKVRECGASSCTQRKVNFDSSAATTEANRPYLSVVYKAPAPIVTTEVAGSVGETAATLKGQVNPHGYATTYQFEYGLTTSYGTKVPTTAESIGSGKSSVAVSKAISGLKGSTTYHYRVSATNAYGTTPGLDKTFTTPKLPSATTEAASGVKEKDATLKGSVNPNGSATTYQFEYGPTTSYGTKVPLSPESVGSGTTAVAVSKAISGLTEGATYHYRVVASSAAGTVNGSDQTLKTTHPPQTTITSATPTYTSHEELSIEFESSQSGSTFKCGVDEGETPTETCTSPYKLPEHLEEGWRTLVVAAVNSEGQADPTPEKWTFNPAIYPPAPTGKITSPEEGRISAGRNFTSSKVLTGSNAYFTLKASWGPAFVGQGVTGVTFQIQMPKYAVTEHKFQTIPGKYVLDGQGHPVTWPIEVNENPGESAPVFLNMAAYEKSYGNSLEWEQLKFRAVFDGGKEGAGASKPVSVSYSAYDAPTDAREQIGPLSLDLITGKYTVSATDVSIPVPGTEANLEFTRVYNSDDSTGGGVLGLGWTPSGPVEQEYEGEAWQRLVLQHQDAVPPYYEEECWEEEGESECEKWLAEAEIPEANWVEVLTNDGSGISFDKNGESYVAPAEAKEYVLTKSGGVFVLADPDGTHTVFTEVSGSEYRPSTVSFQATPGSARLVYEGTKSMILKMMIAPAPTGVNCSDVSEKADYAPKTPGCRTLFFNYLPLSTWTGTSSGLGKQQRLASLTYYDASGSGKGQTVAEYAYESSLYRRGELLEEWDPRVAPKDLKTHYSYEHSYATWLSTITPPGQEPWEISYYEARKLRSVSRASLLEDPSTATTTIAYGVPLSGTGAPYDMSPAAVAKWGQSDFPVNATAVFPPTEVPDEVPSDYDRATVHYMDPDGYEVNTASLSPPSVAGDSITTSETDEHGNVVRALSAQNRLEALQDKDPAERAHELDSHSTYSADGTELLQSWSPVHNVRFENGWFIPGRSVTSFGYDKGAPALKEGETAPRLPTSESVSAVPQYAENFWLDSRTTETKYDWSLRKPTETIVDPNGLALASKTTYNSAGQVIEERQPSDPEGKAAGSTKTVYWTAGANSEESSCGNKPAWAGLPCLTRPVAEPSPTGENPKQPWTWLTKYSSLDQLEETQEKTNGVVKRTTAIEYDSAGRPLTTHVSGEGTAIPPVETTYDEDTGAPTSTQFVCEGECEDQQQLTLTYDELGRPVEYKDADGNVSGVAYDVMGRPVLASDGKGYQTISYDEDSGAATAMTDSAAGTFKATYNADRQMTEQLLPNGLSQKVEYDPSGTAVGLEYVKETGCSEACTWLQFHRQDSVAGQVLEETGTLGTHEYSYDEAGRLTLATETPTGEGCTTRAYSFDKDSNRLSKTTREPAEGGACDTKSAGKKQGYEYDTADRLIGEGIEYDNLGRITSLPAEYSGGGELSTSYYVNDLTHSQSQGGVTNTYGLDASLRQRERVRTGGSEEGTAIYHYAGGSDSPAWTEEGKAWTRNIGALGGSLGALQKSNGEITFQIADMHGDVIATADDDPEATELLSTQKFDEYGNPQQSGFLEGGSAEYGWLGANRRRTQLPSGVIQMGVRSYVPAMGRFLSPDPIPGGSANAYEYAGGDPVNNFDLTGEKFCNRVHGAEVCGRDGKQLGKRIKALKQRFRRESRAAARASHGRRTIVLQYNPKGATTSSIGSILENAADKVIDTVGGGTKKMINGVMRISFTGPEYKAASKAFRLAGAWDPSRLVQYWQCGTWFAGDGGDCDPFEMATGMKTESAR
jgi:RHS repeat-associated protein